MTVITLTATIRKPVVSDTSYICREKILFQTLIPKCSDHLFLNPGTKQENLVT